MDLRETFHDPWVWGQLGLFAVVLVLLPWAAQTVEPGGVFGFATPSDLGSEQVAISVRAAGRNPRHLLLDGTRLALDLRHALYGSAEGR